MGEHDAASIVGQLAGLTSGEPAKEPVMPEDLIRRFCSHPPDGPVTELATTEKDGVRTSHGFCGSIGDHGDSMIVGFDEGYDFLGYLADRGWAPLPAKGDWPYVVYLVSRSSEKLTIAKYCEGDLTIWEFDEEAKAKEFYAGLS